MSGCLCKTCASETCWNAGHDTYIEKCSMYLHKPTTNADRIRAMTDEEMADYLRYHSDSYARYDMDWLDWLKQEAEND